MDLLHAFIWQLSTHPIKDKLRIPRGLLRRNNRPTIQELLFPIQMMRVTYRILVFLLRFPVLENLLSRSFQIL